jgi:thiol:disulfide interchange protein DsbA
MNKFSKIWAACLLAAAALLMASPAQAQGSNYQAGIHYFEIDQAQASGGNDKIVVTEAFSYMCSHCNTFEPFINNWKNKQPESVEFKRIPVIFGRGSWELYARAYVTAEMMGIAEAAHGELMDDLWKEKRIYRSMDELADFYSNFGVTADEFKATSQSFAVDAALRKGQTLTQTYGVSGTPSMVVNGKYLVKASQAVGNYDILLDIVDTLVAREMAASAAASAEES